jgi:hypothetical protein
MASAIFFLWRERIGDRAYPADPFVHLQQLLTELPKAMEFLHLTLRLA